jgi:hypothetical protein
VSWVRRIDPDRLVFLDEAGANLAMGRSHAWVTNADRMLWAWLSRSWRDWRSGASDRLRSDENTLQRATRTEARVNTVARNWALPAQSTAAVDPVRPGFRRTGYGWRSQTIEVGPPSAPPCVRFASFGGKPPST